jgi:hypothetical protein
MADIDGYYGTQKPTSASNEYNALKFIVDGILAQHNFVAWVKVVNVDAPGGLALAGTVDVQPLVNQIDGQGRPVPHAVINGLPYMRAQGGANAIILDPEVGDIGICVFADRDSSAVMSNKDKSNPGSMRTHSMSDGFYIGGMLNAIPEQYVMFADDGITIYSPHKITMQAAEEIDIIAPVVNVNADNSCSITTQTLTVDASDSCTITTPTFTVNGNSQFNGTISATGAVTAPTVHGTTDVTAGSISGKSHTHGLVKAGTDTSGGPQ